MNNTLTTYLLIIASITLTLQSITLVTSLINSIRHTLRSNNHKHKLISNHPELKDIDIDEEELLSFTSGESLKHKILSNEEDSDNTPLMTKLLDEIEDEDDDEYY